MLESDKKFIIRLSNNTDVFSEFSISAEQFNPSTRNDVDARELFSGFSKKIQKIFTRKSYNYILNEYNLLTEYKKLLNAYPNVIKNKLTTPNSETVNLKTFNITGVKLTLSLIINDGERDNIIIERDCYIDKDSYNATARFSTELLETMENFKDQLFLFLKKRDIKLMWDDFNLINKFSMHIIDVRELSKEKRGELLETI